MPEIYSKEQKGPENEQDKNLVSFTAKEVLDKIGFGFGSQQFINILFLQAGASFFLIGLINSLRVIFGNLAYFLIGRFKSLKNKRLIGLSGIIFGFSFLLMAVALFTRSVVLFSSAILISSISVVVYGESKGIFKLSGKAFLVEKIAKYSLIITAISLFIAAYLMDKYTVIGTTIILNIFNNAVSFKMHGYLIVFEIAAISFILAGYILSKAKKEEISNIETTNLQLRKFCGFLVKNKMLLLLVITTMIIGLVQTVGYSYYGIFIYQNFKDDLFGGFLNVAMIFLVSIFTAIIGYFITKINIREHRKFHMLIFGAIMVAFMPFSYYFNPNLVIITIGTIIGVIGSSVVIVTTSLLAIELVDFELRKEYFSFANLASIPLFLIAAPILAYLAQAYGLSILFLILTIISAGVVVMLFAVSIALRKELV